MSLRRCGFWSSYPSALRAEGLDLADVQLLLGHKSPKTTQRYAAVAPGMLTKAGELLQRAWDRESAEADPPNESRGSSRVASIVR